MPIVLTRCCLVLLPAFLLLACGGRTADEAGEVAADAAPARSLVQMVYEGDADALRARFAEDPSLVTASDFNAWDLFYSARSLEVIEVLVEAGLDINGMDANSWGAPVHSHALRGECDGLAALIAAGADIEAPSYSTMEIIDNRWVEYPEETTISIFNDQSTALHLAASGNHRDCVRILLEAGANTEAQAADGRTPLMVAAWFGWFDVVRILLDAGADPAARTKNGWTALHLCAYIPPMTGHPEDYIDRFRQRKTECARLLVEAMGADALTLEDAHGRTPLDIAQAVNQQNILAEFQ